MLVLNVKTLGESVILPLKAKDSKPVIVLCDSGGRAFARWHQLWKS